MKRTKYNDGFDVLAPTDLGNTEDVKAQAIKERTIQIIGKAITDGLVVTVGSGNNINISPGEGYDGDGERIYLSSALLNQGGTVFSTGGTYYVKLSYLEVESDSRAHPITGATEMTRVADSYTLAIDVVAPDPTYDLVLAEVTTSGAAITGISVVNRSSIPEWAFSAQFPNTTETTTSGTLTKVSDALSGPTYQNYYNWVEAGGAVRNASLFVRIRIPEGKSTSKVYVKFWNKSDAGATATVNAEIFDTTDTSVGASADYANAPWTENLLEATAGTFTPGGWMTLKFTLKSANSKIARLGEIQVFLV